MNQNVNQIATEIVSQLTLGWNHADGNEYAAPFAQDADFVTIRGEHFCTKQVIAVGHQQIFDTIYKGSVLHSELIQARLINESMIVAHSENTLNAPSGPLVGQHKATATLVIVKNNSRWQIESFHNTLQPS